MKDEYVRLYIHDLGPIVLTLQSIGVLLAVTIEWNDHGPKTGLIILAIAILSVVASWCASIIILLLMNRKRPSKSETHN